MKTIHDWASKKQRQEKISMVTCYDSCFATLINSTAIDAILVGDSVAQVMHGHTSTIPATLDMMRFHCEAVANASPQQFIIGDLPFLSYRKSLSETLHAVETLMRTGIQAVKLEGGDGNYQTIQHITESGVPVMGHIGLTPQRVHQLGGYKLQGRQEAQAQQLIHQAQQLTEAGCFALVLECVPSLLAEQITESIPIPTIGIGAGSATDGQVLVLHDLLGLNNNFNAKFVKHFAQGYEYFQQALNCYHQEVTTSDFPTEQHSY